MTAVAVVKALVFRHSGDSRQMPISEQEKARRRAWMQANRERLNARRRELYAASAERKAARKSWVQSNPEKIRVYTKKYKAKDRDAYLQRKREDYARSRAKRFGMTVEDVESMFVAQRGRCAICEVALMTSGRGPTSMALDHDHKTGQPRAILCSSCNRGIGYLREDPEIMRKAIEYVTAPPQLRLVKGGAL